MSENLELDAAALQIKAIRARRRKALTRAEVIELLERPIYLGVPKPIPQNKRGRKPKRVAVPSGYVGVSPMLYRVAEHCIQDFLDHISPI